MNGSAPKLLKIYVNENEHRFLIGCSTEMIPPSETLAETLRDRLGLTGTKTPCNKGACGGCTVLLNGSPVLACSVLTAECDGAYVTTIEGVANSVTGELHPVQQAFIEVDAIQCGMCTPGIVMASISLLENNDNPTENEVREALSGNICRCTGYVKYIDGVMLAAKILRENKEAYHAG